jgi:pimeloyl-ACP methyl ester carboxylesterase
MRLFTRGAIALALVSVILVAPPAQADELRWEACGVGQQCAWLTVPIDHADPSLGSLDLRVVRVLARGPSSRGALVVNPGGPGASGADFVRLFALSAPEAIREQFDLVGFDPRGVGQSSPIRCLSDARLAQFLRTDSTPQTLREQRIFMQRASAFGPGCLADQPRLAPHLNSEQTISDMNQLREALGEPRLNFLGFSYGTLLGARFAETFPDRVGRFVLDGGVDSELTLMQASRDQATGFQQALQRFAAQCARQSRCTLGGTPTQVIQNINALLRQLQKQPIPTAGPTTLVQSEAITAIATAMYSTEIWPTLERALTRARAGDGTLLQRLAYVANDQVGPKRFASNIAFAFLATLCLDLPAPPGRSGLAAAAQRWSTGAAIPELTRALAWSNAACHSWFRHGPPPTGVSSTTTAPIMIIGTRFDPATPYHWSQKLRRALPTSALLTYDGDGHTAFASGVRCVDDAVSAYLLTGVARDQTCRK